MKNSIYNISLLLSITLLLTSCKQQGNNVDNNNATKAAINTTTASEQNMPTVGVEKPQQRSFSGNLEITGTLVANQRVSLRAMEGGFLQTISKDIGDYVKAGQVIATLENPQLRQALKLTEAELASFQGDLKQADAKIKSMQAKLDYKRSYHNRIKSIYDKTPDLMTIDELENAKAEMLVAEAELAVVQTQPEVIRARLNAAQAKVDAANVRISQLEVKAPFSGHITHRYLDKGAFVQSAVSNASASAIFDIVDMNKLRLVVEYPESDIANVHVGSTVEIEFPELGGKSVKAKITRMAAAMNPKTKTVRAEIDLPKPDKALKAGMYANVKTKQVSNRSALSINKQAITAVKNKPYIFKVVNGKAQRMAVQLGMEDRDYIEVLSEGLGADDLVVVKGKAMVSEGMPVKTASLLE